MSNLTACQKIANWVTHLTLEAIPENVRRTAMQSWVDVMGCMIGGAQNDSVKKLFELVKSEHGDGQCSLFGTENHTSPIGAALANGAAAHALDFDDTCYAGVVHASATVGAAVMAAAEHTDADGKTAFTAFIAGLEAEYAFGRAASNQLFMDGWWTTSVFGGLGAAAGAGKAMGLDAPKTAAAIAHALCRVSGLRVANGTDAKFIGNGQTASLGVTSAFFADADLSSPLDALEGSNGMAQLIKRGPIDLASLDMLGKTWSLIDPGVYIKPYPSCSASHAAAEATTKLLIEHNLSPEDIISVNVEAPQIVVDSLIYDNPERIPEGQFSLQFIIGCVIIDKSFDVTRTSSKALEDPAVRSLMDKISLTHDPELTARSKSGEIGPECAKVYLTTAKGETLKLFNSEAIGAPAKPMSKEQLDAKFLNLATFSGRKGNADIVLERIRNIVELESCRDLWTT